MRQPDANSPLMRFRAYFDRAYDIATGTTNRSRRWAAHERAVVTALRNAIPHIGEQQRARMRRRIAEGKTGLLPVKEQASV